MRRRSVLVAALLLATLVAPIAGAKAASPAVEPGLRVRLDATTGRPRVVTAASGYLTGPSSRDRGDLALAWLAGHTGLFGLDGNDLRQFVVASEATTPSNGETHVSVEQQVDGVKVMGAVLTFAFDAQGRLVLAGGNYDPDLGSPGAPKLSAQGAVIAAVAASGGRAPAELRGATKQGDTYRFDNHEATDVTTPADHTAELVAYPVTGGRAAIAWRTEVEVGPDNWNEIVVDATNGTVLATKSLYSHSGPEGTVHTGEHPAESTAPQIVNFTPWVFGTTTAGNNANAYEDRDANNAADPGSVPTEVNAHFNYAFTDAVSTNATTTTGVLDTDRQFSVTQMFYYTNLLHDFLYGLGFTEAFRNFQVNNFGNGGAAGDPVNAEARDGWGTGTETFCTDRFGNPIRCRNNANFATPKDGNSPRMQMYLFTSPSRDGALDGDVIAHEYGHGLSNRLVAAGNLGSGLQAGSLGEGWSDVVSMMLWDDPVIGEYVTGNVDTGIRRVRYDTSTLDYGDFTSAAGVHANGQIWATTMWNVLDALRGRYGSGPGLAKFRQLIVDGLKATVTSPTMVDARDGFLAADTAKGSPDRCLLWVQFAERLLGDGAGGTATTATTSTAIPADCRPTAEAGGPYSTTHTDNVVLNGSASTAGTHPSVGGLSYAWDLDADGQYDDATGATPSFGAALNPGVYTVGLRVTNGAGATDTDTATVTITAVTNLSITMSDSPDPVLLGQPLTYTLPVGNAGPSTATGVKVVDTLPASVTFVSATPTQGSCSDAAGTVTCQLGTLVKNASASLTIEVIPNAGGIIVNTATVSGNENDPVAGDNVAQASTLVKGVADLSITKTGGPNPILVGGALSYTLTVANAGPSTATGVKVVDTLPAAITFGSATPSQGSCSQAAGVVTCQVGSLVKTASATIVVQVTPNAKGTITNVATVSAVEDDRDPSDNATNTSTRVIQARGRAFGEQVRSLLVNSGPAPLVLRLVPGSSSATALSINLGAVLNAFGLSVRTEVGPGIVVTSSADVTKATLVGNRVGLEGVHTECKATLSGTTALTTIAKLTVNGQTQLNVVPQPNSTIGVIGGKLVLNEQTTVNTATNKAMTVSGVHLQLLTGEDIVLAQSSCGLDG